ncbi:uncharacterized protein LOC132204257 isoform X2 [Neocloeon triangulifer]|uniref:uncharacterized protein LOC132204257 isoform X2 n=1 Tax=Neocloeon triangulifer TaxID=2078957 RepID=UPI00286EC951|nr:uncharacterized protein LOC132204257 isoform X2 [Neocloeon triangulifer]
MWFCCQAVQCNLKSCFGVQEMWKAWQGWSHVVHPSGGKHQPFGAPAGAASEDNSRSVVLQRQLSIKTVSPFFARQCTAELNASEHVEVNLDSRGSDFEESACYHPKGVSVRLSGAGSSSSILSPRGSFRRDRTKVAIVDQNSSPPASPVEAAAGAAAPPTVNSPRRTPRKEASRETSKGGLEVVMEWDGSPPHRAPSTDWTPLEMGLYHYREELSKQQLSDESSSDKGKVRYNDTGSLEEVNAQSGMVDYFLDDMMEHNPTDFEDLRLQYKQLWELRATFEEDDEEISDSPPSQELSRVKVEEEDYTKNSTPLEKEPILNSPADLSPDPATSHTTSFESNTEPLLNDDPPVRWPPHLLQLPSYESRRQTYKNVLTSRLRRKEGAATFQPLVIENSSFDSMETVDTEGSSTDASRLEQLTTSFESTTDNTDSLGEGGQGHVGGHSTGATHKFCQQVRADSGYRSFETHAPRLSQKQDSIDLDEPLEGGANIKTEDELASKKRREFHGGRRTPDSLYFESVNELETDSRSGGESPSSVTTTTIMSKRNKAILMPRYLRHNKYVYSSLQSRDYSVDEKSDALFREFSRCDPTYDVPPERQHRLSRRLHQHRSSDFELHYFKRNRRVSPPLSLDGDAILKGSCSESLKGIPIIRVADDDSSDCVY